MGGIAIRVDGGPDIGMGHLMRCLALADAFPGEHDIIFISKPDVSVKREIVDTRYDLVSIDENISHEDEIRVVKDILKEHRIETFIADTFHIDSSNDIDEVYLSEIEKVVDRTVFISPKVSNELHPDIVINGNVFAEELGYEDDEDTVFLLGPRYVLLRDEFQDLPNRGTDEKVQNILVTMGGADPSDLFPKVLKAIGMIDEDVHVDLMIGPAVKERDELIRSIEEVEFDASPVFDPEDVSGLMMKADMAVSAGGGTLYELAATGTPAIVLLQAENQVPVASAMEKEGTIMNLGFGDKVNVEKLADAMMDLMNDPRRREEMSMKGRKLIDGLGAKRCMNVIMEN